ncbi:MAG TPA: hypothetical protein VEJ20_07035 [Candidatus Eremiobacteraceae bacterium]|nr:hypothetical protein [Candidatus Eremiobacteraceae bacterium]
MLAFGASFASCAAALLLAASGGPATISGTLISLGETARGPVITIESRGGTPLVVDVAPDAVVEARVNVGGWKAIGLTSLLPGEPLTLTVDAAGDARRVDADYAVVDTRAVVLQDGYLVGTDGIARKLVGTAAAIRDIPLGAYVELSTDAASGDVFDATVSLKPFVNANEKVVAVTLDVLVPINTPAGSTIYVATNAQSWTANAIRMSPLPGNKWTVTLDLAAGTVLQYKYTRGSWGSEERDAAGSEIADRTLAVGTGSTQHVEDIVARWADLPS